MALGESASFFAINSGSVVGSVSLTTSAYKVVHELGKPNQIKRNTLVTGTDETAYMRKHNILEDVGTVIDLANKTFENKEYQLQLDLVADPEAEQWETLVFRFFVGMTPPEILHYQKELVRNFVARIEPSKRSYFSMVVEPV